MEIGFNNDVVYRGATFHIQTEDHGGHDQKVSTQLFYRGAIIDTRTVSYANLIREIANDEERRDKIRKVMVKSHRSLYKRLFAGEYDANLAEDIRNVPAAPNALDAEEFEPKQERVPEVAKVVEEDGKVTFTFDHGDQIDLEALSRQLSQIDIYGDKERGGFGGTAGDFDNLFAEFGATPSAPPPPASRSAPAAQTSPEPIAPQIIHVVAPAEPTKVEWRPTGKRAFQGLIEPAPDLRVIDMVREFMQGR
jgi:hypothetical protein